MHRVRDHGGLLFIDLRDHYGLTQVVADPDSPAFKAAETVRSEWVIRVDGKVRERPEGTLNPDLPTGEVEVFAGEIEVLSAAKELPMPVFGEPDYPEDLRLQYRFLDLRRETLHKNIMLRIAIIASIRRRMREAGFFEFQTPILTASSPEGARDFLVPSRMHPGKFYALPQAPQQFKQLIMIAGFDRYFQIAPCFRDEDPRADRSPGEFYQLDVEMSFVEQEDVFAGDRAGHARRVRGVRRRQAGDGDSSRASPTTRRSRKYGTDKPDLRNPIEMQDVTEHFRGSGFKVFAGMIEKDPKARVWAIPRRAAAPRLLRPHERLGAGARASRASATSSGARARRERRRPDRARTSGLERAGAIRRSSSALKDGRRRVLRRRQPGQVLQVRRRGAHQDRPRAEADRRGPVRVLLDRRLPDVRVERGGEEDRLLPQPVLHAAGRARRRWRRPRATRTCSRSRPTSTTSSATASSWLGRHPQPPAGDHGQGLRASPATDQSVLEANVRRHAERALQYGAPPHGGMAAGIDRIVMLLAGAKNLREVIMFPMNQQAQDLLMGAPSRGDAEAAARAAHPRRGAGEEGVSGLTRALDRVLGSLVRRIARHAQELAWRDPGGALRLELQRRATAAAADFVTARMPDALYCASKLDHLTFAFKQAPPGLALEFGVFKGTTINHLRELGARAALSRLRQLYGVAGGLGGLPLLRRQLRSRRQEAQGCRQRDADRGLVRQDAAGVLGPRGRPDRLPARRLRHLFLDQDGARSLRPRLAPGAVVVFDEFFNYKGYELHEYKAFFEFVERFDVAYRFIGYAGQQVSLVVEAVRGNAECSSRTLATTNPSPEVQNILRR